MARLIFLIGAGMAAIAPVATTEAFAQPTIAVAPLDGRAVVAAIRRTLADNYVLKEVRPKLDAALAAGLASGRYDVADPSALVERINADLTAVAHDKHLGIHYDPTEAAEIAQEPAGAGADDAPPTANDIRGARRRNHGIVQMKLLPGNIRYIAIDGFVWVGPTSAAAIDNAMRFIGDGDAVIIDLRNNGGGSPEAVQYLISHFVAANTPLVTFHMGANRVNSLSSLATLPAGRMVGKPLYVLTSGMTASAAEEFTGHVAGYRLGELIGEPTAGAGFRNTLFALPGGFVTSVSVGRAVLASTGKDWEGVGIPPTTKVVADHALDVAESHALRRLAATASPAQKAEFDALATVLAAKVDPVATALPLAAYAGTFGERTVMLDKGALVFRRGNGPTHVLIPIAANRFAFEDDPIQHLTFSVVGNSATGFELVRNDGSHVIATRNP